MGAKLIRLVERDEELKFNLHFEDILSAFFFSFTPAVYPVKIQSHDAIPPLFCDYCLYFIFEQVKMRQGLQQATFCCA